MKEFTEVLREFQNEKNIYHLEGERGVKNLARICNAIGYKDSTYFGQFDQNGSYGDLINFLEDNSGAVECIVEWIEQQDNDEWTENLQSHLTEKEDEEEESND